jgi:hypothetical protein
MFAFDKLKGDLLLGFTDSMEVFRSSHLHRGTFSEIPLLGLPRVSGEALASNIIFFPGETVLQRFDSIA